MIKDEKKYKILLIEDNNDDFIRIQRFIEEKIAVPAITHARNFKTARLLLTENKCNYDVILLDLTLPDKSGEKLITGIFSLCAGCPLIVITGYADFAFSIKSFGMGVTDYLLKDEINAASLYKSIVYNIERNKTIVKLEESEKRYSNLFHLSPQPMWICDLDTLTFVQVNKAALEQYGYTEKEFLKMTIEDIQPAEESLKVRSSFFDKPPVDGMYYGRCIHYRKSGEMIEVDIYSSLISLENKIYRSVIAIDVSEKALHEYNITKAIIKTQEDERYEIGTELHDNVCQILATSQISLGMLQESLTPSDMPWFNKCREYLILATDEIRNLSHRLAPAFFEDSTLEDTFRILLDTFNMEDKYKISLRVDAGVSSRPLNREVQLNLYRILQEHLINILKYAKASVINVNVNISNNNLLLMTIADNGIGFNLHAVKKGIGFANMKRRAELFSGRLSINSSSGKGCSIEVEIPLEEIQGVKS